MLQNWQQDIAQREHDARVALVAKQTRAEGRTPCDVCGQPATVIVTNRAQHFASFRCAQDALGMERHFGQGTTVEALVSAGAR